MLNRWHRRSWLSLMSLSVYTLKDISASQERLCHLLSKNYNSACAICWENIILHPHPEIKMSFKFIPKILMSKECIHFLGHSVYLLTLGYTFRFTRNHHQALSKIHRSINNILIAWIWCFYRDGWIYLD